MFFLTDSCSKRFDASSEDANIVSDKRNCEFSIVIDRNELASARDHIGRR